MLYKSLLISMAWGVMLSVLQLLISISLASATVYLGLRLFDKTIRKIDALKEIKKGNVAVAIFIAAVVLSIAIIVQVGVENITVLLGPEQTTSVMMAAILVGVLQLLVSIVLAIFSISLAARVLERVASEIDCISQLKRGNIAVGILMSGVLLSIAFVIRAGVAGLVCAINP